VERIEPVPPIAQGGRRSARQSQTPGPRAVLEFLEKLIRHDILDEPVIEDRLGVYACPNPIIVGDLSADRTCR
jgi:hypothetical protein